MQPLTPDILMPPFKQYYPSIDSLNGSQRIFYEYWKSEFEVGSPREADTSYIFIYVYDLFDKYLKGIDREMNLTKLIKLKALYRSQVGNHIASWLSDIYLLENRYEDAISIQEEFGGRFNSDNLSLFLKMQTNREISPDDIVLIAKRFGFVQLSSFKKHISEVHEWLDLKIKSKFPKEGMLKFVLASPSVSMVDEYLTAGLVSNQLATIKIPDLLSNPFLSEKCVAWTLEISDLIQQKYARKSTSKKPNKQRQNIERALWDVRIKEVFKNPTSSLENKGCIHEYLRLQNHWMVYRKYECAHCDEIFMCECDKKLAMAIRSYQTEGRWLVGICPNCRGFEDASIVTDGKLMYGSSFYAVRWREIAKESDRLAIENKDEPDYSRAENNIRLKYGVPLIGEGWISETQLFKNLEQLLSDHKVIHHGKPEWLGRMHLDVYIPELKDAFEYQGKQHYQAVNYFGGQESFKQTQKRDKEKARLCEENGVTLFYINEGDDFSVDALRLRIKNMQ